MSRVALEHQVAGGSHGTAIPWTGVLITPHLFLMNRIPREEESFLPFERVPENLPFTSRDGRQIDSHVVADRGGLEMFIGLECETFFLRRYIDQAGLRVECHRLPVMATARRRISYEGFAGFIIASGRVLHRPAGLKVD